MNMQDVIRFHCRCGSRLKAPERYAGKRVRCPACKRISHVPDQSDTGITLAQLMDETDRPPAPQKKLEDTVSGSGSLQTCRCCHNYIPPTTTFCEVCGQHVDQRMMRLGDSSLE